MNKDIFNVKEGIMEDNRKGTWEDVTGECTLKWWEDAFDGTKGHIDIKHDGQRVAIVGHQVNADVGGAFGGEYRVITTPDGTYSGTIKVEHFTPDPEPEWTDITAECHLTFGEHESGYYIRIGYDDEIENKALGYVGDKVEMSYPHDYRITAYPRKVRRDYDSGCIKVEKRNG